MYWSLKNKYVRAVCLSLIHKLLIFSQLKGSFDGFRFVLIGDLHEQPMLHLKVKPFVVGAKDWTHEVSAGETMEATSLTKSI